MVKKPTPVRRKTATPRQEAAAGDDEIMAGDDTLDEAIDEPTGETADEKAASPKAAAGANTNMRMAYCATEIGTQLRIDHPAVPDYSLIKAYDSSLKLGPNASKAATQAALASVDPTITSAT